MPPAALLGSATGLLVAYVAAEAVLSLTPHPVHWLAGASGAAAGIALGYLYQWQRRRADHR